MKISLTGGMQRKRGFTTLVVIILLILISSLLVNNTRTIQQLERELDLLDARQVKKYDGVAGRQESNNQTALK